MKRSLGCFDGWHKKFPLVNVKFTLESDACQSFSDTESNHSYQLQETASARDTSDTASKSEVSEYTPASLSGGGISEASSSPDDVFLVGDFTKVYCSDLSNIEVSSDGSEESSDHEHEISKIKNGKCLQCGTTEKYWQFFLCISCFRAKKSELPPRPRRRKGKLSLNRFNSTYGPNLNVGERKCTKCRNRPVDSIFLHGDTAHELFCYECSSTEWNGQRRCPLCNRACKVVRVYRSSKVNCRL